MLNCHLSKSQHPSFKRPVASASAITDNCTTSCNNSVTTCSDSLVTTSCDKNVTTADASCLSQDQTGYVNGINDTDCDNATAAGLSQHLGIDSLDGGDADAGTRRGSRKGRRTRSRRPMTCERCYATSATGDDCLCADSDESGVTTTNMFSALPVFESEDGLKMTTNPNTIETNKKEKKHENNTMVGN